MGNARRDGWCYLQTLSRHETGCRVSMNKLPAIASFSLVAIVVIVGAVHYSRRETTEITDSQESQGNPTPQVSANADGAGSPAADAPRMDPNVEKLVKSGKVVIQTSSAPGNPIPGQKYYKEVGHNLILGTLDAGGNFISGPDPADNIDLSKTTFVNLHYPMLGGTQSPPSSGTSNVKSRIIEDTDGSQIEVIYEPEIPPD